MEGPGGQAPSVQLLQRKLKEAARTVLHLQLEKEQLLELGNRLRAELGRPAGEQATGGPGRGWKGQAQGRERGQAPCGRRRVQSLRRAGLYPEGGSEPAHWPHL